jgi:hypothetical protein
MTPGDVSDLSASGAVAFRVHFFTDMPPPVQRYWRGPVLHEFDGRSWRRPRSQAFPDQSVAFHGAATDYQITLDRALREINWAETAKLQNRLIDDCYHGVAVGCYLEGGASGPKETAYFKLTMGTAPIGALASGSIAQRFGAPVATTVSAIVLLGGALWMLRRLRVLALREAVSSAPVPATTEKVG